MSAIAHGRRSAGVAPWAEIPSPPSEAFRRGESLRAICEIPLSSDASCNRERPRRAGGRKLIPFSSSVFGVRPVFWRENRTRIRMGFDKDDESPLIHPERRATKVNLWMIVGILMFFVAAGVVVWYLARNPAAATP
jgi:hypothetical protein